MKINNFTRNGLIALSAITALTLGACKKAPEESGNTGNAEEKGSPEKEAAAPAGKKVAEQIVGYWAPDEASLRAIMEGEVAGQVGGNEEIAKKILGPLVEAMIEFFAIEITSEKFIMASPEGAQEQAYELLSSDEATGEFVAKIADAESGEIEESKGTIKGDSLSLTMDGDAVTMNRISPEDFKTREKKAADFNPEALLAPLMQEILGGLIPEGGAGLPPGLLPE